MDAIKTHPGSSPKKLNLLSFLKYEHLVAGISGGVTSTLILHPLDLIKIRFAGESQNVPGGSLGGGATRTEIGSALSRRPSYLRGHRLLTFW